MKAFFLAVMAMGMISIVADYMLNRAGFSSAEVFQTDSVRLE